MVTSVQMKEIERRADEAGLSYYQMMENAGIGAAERMASKESVAGKSVLIFCGKGNNGGDGFVVARELTEIGASVQLVLVEGEPKTADAIKNRQICKTMDIPMIGIDEDKEISHFVEAADLIVDGIYGTGFHGELKEPVRKITRMINQSKATVYALDIPSGLNGDTGEADEDTIRAACNIVFHQLKPAHCDEKSRGYCGEIICISIGIDEMFAKLD